MLFTSKPSLVDEPARGRRAGSRAKSKVLDDVVHSRLWGVFHVVELVRPTTVVVGKTPRCRTVARTYLIATYLPVDQKYWWSAQAFTSSY
jgi:hypothetical protein